MIRLQWKQCGLEWMNSKNGVGCSAVLTYNFEHWNMAWLRGVVRVFYLVDVDSFSFNQGDRCLWPLYEIRVLLPGTVGCGRFQLQLSLTRNI